ncbi:MAG: hypothetical protein ACXWPM_01070 [Bdellovibrionota bacterium]
MFNTLKYAKMLEEVGFSRAQAETSIYILAETMDENLASKQDLTDLRQALKQDVKDVETRLENSISSFRSEVNHSLSQLESKLTIRMGTMLAASIAVLTAIQKLV